MTKTPGLLASIKSLLRDKKLRYGGYATLVSGAVIGVIIAVNVLVDQIPAKIDMTERRYFTLSDQTIQILDRLAAPVQIYGYFQTGQENALLEELIRKYTARSRWVNYKSVDPIRNPTAARKYQSGDTSLAESSLVVESGERFEVISPWDLVNYSYNQETQSQEAQSQQFEAQITKAILEVTTSDLPTVGTLTLHDERAIPYEVTRQLSLENFQMREVNLATEGRVPQEVSVLVVNGPSRDLTVDELGQLRDYLQGGGRMLLQIGNATQEMPRWNELIAGFGLAVRNMIVVDQDPRYVHWQNPLFLLPGLQTHDILSPLRTADLAILLPIPVYVEQLELRKRTVTVEPLLLTSESAFAKRQINTPEDLVPTAADPHGPLALAVAATDRLDDTGTHMTRIVVVANANYLEVSEYPGNANFFFNAISWLNEREDTMGIRPKLLGSMQLFMSQMEARWFSAVVVIVIPLIAFGMGVFVWLRRRHL